MSRDRFGRYIELFLRILEITLGACIGKLGPDHAPARDQCPTGPDAASILPTVADVYRKLRRDYNEGLKSPNKGYAPGSQKHARNLGRIELARGALRELRKHKATAHYHETLLDSIPAAQCGDLAVAAMDRCRDAGLAASVWTLGSERGRRRLDHAFTVVTPTEADLRALSATRDFNSPEWRKACIVDGWIGLCCPASDFNELARAKMQKWAREGKVIRDASREAWESPTSAEWMKGIQSDLKARAPQHPPYLPLDLSSRGKQIQQRHEPER